MITEAVKILSQGADLSRGQMQEAMEEIMSAKADTPQIVSFLTALSNKGETAEEITAAASVMRKFAAKVNVRDKVVLDTCGTGGDKSGTFNISTAAAFVAGGCGITVAKHGNRSVSSRSGSADVLEALGVDINLGKEKIEQCLDEVGIAFLFAQNFHPATRYAMPARKEIGKRTMFNILGPLTNPAGATHQVVGVYDKEKLTVLAQVLMNLGSAHALIVHGEDGLDELTTCGKTYIAEQHKGGIKNYELTPEEFGIKRAASSGLAGAGAKDNAKIILDILGGKKGPQRDIVVLNAAAAIYAADKAGSIKEGIGLAEGSIDSGAALKKLERLREFSKRDE